MNPAYWTRRRFKAFLLVLLLSILLIGVFEFPNLPNVKANPDSNTWQVSASANDAYRRDVTSAWSVTIGAEICGDYTETYYDYSSGMRFLSVNVPQNANITSANLELKAKLLYGSIPQVIIDGEVPADGDADEFTLSTDYDNRLRTGNSTTWTPPSWTINSWYNSSDISSVIQEIVDDSEWVSGNAVVIFWRHASGWGGTQELIYAYSWDNTSSYAPKLHITWTPTSPKYQNVGPINGTSISQGDSLTLYSQGYDESGLDWAWLSTNETGSWKNYTMTATSDSNLEWIFDRMIEQKVNSSFPYVIPYDEQNDINHSHIARNDLLFGVRAYQYTGNTTFLDYAYEYANWLNNTATNVRQLFYDYNLTSNEWVMPYSTEYLTDPPRSQIMAVHLTDLCTLAEINSSYVDLVQSAANEFVNHLLNQSSYLMWSNVLYNGTVDISDSNAHSQGYAISALSYVANVTSNSTLMNIATEMCCAYTLGNADLPYFKIDKNGDVVDTYCKEDQTFGNFVLGLETCYYFSHNTTIKNLINKTCWAGAQHIWHSGNQWFQYRTDADTGGDIDTSAVHGFGIIDEAMLIGYLIWGNTTWRDYARQDYDTLVINGSILSNGLIMHSTLGGGFADADLYWNQFGFRVGLILYSIFNNSTYLQAYNYLYGNTTATGGPSLYGHKYDKGYVQGVDSGGGGISTRFGYYRWDTLLSGNVMHILANRSDTSISTLTGHIATFGIPYMGNIPDWTNPFDIYGSPMDLNDVADTWTWSNFTWSNSSISGKIHWQIFYNDTTGNENGTDMHYFIVENIAPTIDALRLSTIPSDTNITSLSVNVYYEWEVNITDTVGITDIENLTIRIENNPGNTIIEDTPTFTESSEYWFHFDNSTGTEDWEWYNGTSWSTTETYLNLSGCIAPSGSATTGWFKFQAKLSKIATHASTWQFAALVYDASDNDTASFNTVTIAFYSELSVANSHTWTDVSPGSANATVDGGSVQINITCNAPIDLQAKGDGDLTYNGHTIPLGNVRIHNSTLANSITLTTSYQDIPDLTNLAAGESEHTCVLWITVPNGTEDGNYTYTLTIKCVEHT